MKKNKRLIEKKIIQNYKLKEKINKKFKREKNNKQENKRIETV